MSAAPTQLCVGQSLYCECVRGQGWSRVLCSVMVLSLFLSLVSWRAQGSSWLFCTQQFGAVLCLSPGAFQDTLCPYPEHSVLGLQPWAVENVCLQVWHWVEKHPAEGLITLEVLGHQA